MLGSCTMGCRKAAQSKWLDTSAVSGAGSHWSSVHVGKQKGLSSRKPEDGSSCGSQRVDSLSSKGKRTGADERSQLFTRTSLELGPHQEVPSPPGGGSSSVVHFKKGLH